METARNLWHRHRATLGHASREVLVTAIITLTPVWAGAALSLLFQEAPSFLLALSANAAKGDLFLLATAAIAPLTLYLSVRPGTLPKPLTIQFPGGWFFILSLILLFGGVTILFSIKRTAELPDSTLKLNQALFVNISIIAYVASIVLSLIVTSIWPAPGSVDTCLS
jgi:hypothetical protein